MLYKNTEAMVRSPAGDTDFFEVLSGLLLGYTLAPFFFILLLDYVLQTSVDPLNEISFTLKKARRRYLAKTITKNKNWDAEKLLHAQLAITCTKSTIDRLEQRVKSVRS